MIKAVLDACVLYPAQLRDFLLRLPRERLLFPFWSEEIHNEWTRSLQRNCPKLKQEKLERTRRKMDTHFPNSLVRGYEPIIPTLHLPDPNDRHVLAAAIHAKAECIVTFNLHDFPKSVLQRYEIEATSPDEIVLRLICEAPTFVLRVAKSHRLSLTRPSFSPSEYLAMLAKQRLPQTVAFLRKHESEV